MMANQPGQSNSKRENGESQESFICRGSTSQETIHNSSRPFSSHLQKGCMNYSHSSKCYPTLLPLPPPALPEERENLLYDGLLWKQNKCQLKVIEVEVIGVEHVTLMSTVRLDY